MRLAAALVTSGLLAASAPSSADTVTWFGQFEAVSGGSFYSSLDPSDPGSFFLDFSRVVGIPRFDPALGTLTDITLTVDPSAPIQVEIGGDLTGIQDDPGELFAAEAYVDGDYGVYYDSTSFLSTLLVDFFSAGASCDGGVDDGGCGDSLYGVSDSLSGTSSILGSVDPADFIGASGSVESLIVGLFYPVSAEFPVTDNVSEVTLDLFFDLYDDGIGEGPIGITYSYEPVPLPPAVALLGPALLLLGRWRRS
jgi:hypothetical protein